MSSGKVHVVDAWREKYMRAGNIWPGSRLDSTRPDISLNIRYSAYRRIWIDYEILRICLHREDVAAYDVAPNLSDERFWLIWKSTV